MYLWGQWGLPPGFLLFAINTINPPAKNESHHQTFLASPSLFFLSLQILLPLLLSLSSCLSLLCSLFLMDLIPKYILFNYLMHIECKERENRIYHHRGLHVCNQDGTDCTKWDGLDGEGGQNVPGFCEMKCTAYVWTYLKSAVSEFWSWVYLDWSACKAESECIRTSGKMV